MFQIGDMVVYQNMGVCRVKAVAAPSFDSERKYYELEPINARGTIFIPVDTEVFIRPVIGREEAERLIDSIPSIQAEAYGGTAPQEIAQHYTEALHSHDCADLIELVMSIYDKKRVREQQNQKFGSVDESFMKRAEELLYGEFAAALDIPQEDVQAYIEKRVQTLEKRRQA